MEKARKRVKIKTLNLQTKKTVEQIHLTPILGKVLKKKDLLITRRNLNKRKKKKAWLKTKHLPNKRRKTRKK